MGRGSGHWAPGAPGRAGCPAAWESARAWSRSGYADSPGQNSAHAPLPPPQACPSKVAHLGCSALSPSLSRAVPPRSRCRPDLPRLLRVALTGARVSASQRLRPGPRRHRPSLGTQLASPSPRSQLLSANPSAARWPRSVFKNTHQVESLPYEPQTHAVPVSRQDAAPARLPPTRTPRPRLRSLGLAACAGALSAPLLRSLLRPELRQLLEGPRCPAE